MPRKHLKAPAPGWPRPAEALFGSGSWEDSLEGVPPAGLPFQGCPWLPGCLPQWCSLHEVHVPKVLPMGRGEGVKAQAQATGSSSPEVKEAPELVN